MQPSPFLLLLSASAIALSADASRGYDYGGDSNGVKPPLHTSPNWVNAQRVYGNLGYGLPFTTEASMALKCPTFVNCAPSIQALAPVKTLVKSSAGTICIYDPPNNLNSCNLSPAASYCVLGGRQYLNVYCDPISSQCELTEC